MVFYSSSFRDMFSVILLGKVEMNELMDDDDKCLVSHQKE